jgi:IS30 family transposase
MKRNAINALLFLNLKISIKKRASQIKKHTQLKKEKRVDILKLRQSGHQIKEISVKLNRAKSTISRETTRNKYSDTIVYLVNKAHFLAINSRHVQPLKIDKILNQKKLFQKSEKVFTRCNCS